MSRRPETHEVSSEYQWSLINQAQGDCVLRCMDDQLYWTCELASHLSAEQVDKIHAPYGWTIRQVIEHCANAERIFGYRILRAAAGDETELPGWAENDYADARFGLGNFGDLITELALARQANLILLRRIVPQAWDRVVTADQVPLCVRAIAWIAAGHLHHHLAIVEKRCGIQVDRAKPSI